MGADAIPTAHGKIASNYSLEGHPPPRQLLPARASHRGCRTVPAPGAPSWPRKGKRPQSHCLPPALSSGLPQSPGRQN